MRIKSLATAALALFSFGLAAPVMAAPVTAASAATTGCSNDSNQGITCGSYDVSPGGSVGTLMMAVHNSGADGSAIEVKAASSSNNTEDFIPNTTAGTYTQYEWAPDGARSGDCVQVAGTSLLLEKCASISAQEFIAESSNYGEFALMAPGGGGLVVTDPNGGGAYTNLDMETFTNTANQGWSFQG
jgi:hypothetical protein